jgi:hypothetical protein
VVFVDQSAESVATLDLSVAERFSAFIEFGGSSASPR